MKQKSEQFASKIELLTVEEEREYNFKYRGKVVPDPNPTTLMERITKTLFGDLW